MSMASSTAAPPGGPCAASSSTHYPSRLCRLLHCAPRAWAAPVAARRATPLAQATPGGGFGAPKQQEDGAAPSTSSPSTSVDAVEALEARIRNRRARKASDQPRVQVNAPVVDAVSGKGPATPQAQAETNFVTAMLFLFTIVILEGLVIAGSGFLPEDWDGFVQDVLYPNYSPTVLLFLGMSSLYGLWKVGKISLPFMGTAPPDQEQK